jgi:outer membrane protein assembly factor BamB
MRVALLALLPLLLAADWPAWRGPAGNGVSTEKNLPEKWSAAENVLWKAPLPGVGVSTPAVVGSRVFVTASDNRRNERLHIIAFDATTGKELWHTRLFGSAIPESEFPPGGMAAPSPACDDKRVFALFGSGDLVALDFDGKPLWVRSLADEYGPFRNRWGMSSSPLVVGDIVVLQVDHWGGSYLLAVDAATGKNRWRTPREAAVNWTSPVLATAKGKPQIIASGTYLVKGYDGATGKELWTVKGMQQQCIPTPIVADGFIYAVSGRKGNSLKIRLDGAAGDVTNSHVVWRKPRGAPFTPSGVVYDGRYYLIDDDGLGTCLDAKTGESVWQERMGGHYQASLAAGDGKIYFTNMEGVVTVVQASEEFEVVSNNKLDEAIHSSPALAAGKIYLRGERYLYCIGSRSP